ncbi:MAG TPA: MBL fold metallo-hydrolase [Opitutaceae bacterium]|nr:MBL fold metallo-hydrolase [Opitutaceae bacterium]
MFLAIEHPDLGWILCDTGYGDSFFKATRRFPDRLYRWATPVTLRGTAASALRAIGVCPENVRHIVITHFHADHVGGLHEFPSAQLHYHEEALSPLQACTAFAQTKAAFLPDLVPADCGERSRVVPHDAFKTRSGFPFRVCDLFGDGSITLVELPGHAPGQVGLEFETVAGKILYCADAFWRSTQVRERVNLPRPVRALQWNPTAYQQTLEALRDLEQQGSHRLIACHDDATQQYVTT